MDTCQICLDAGEEKLQDIKLCQCKYKCHNSCWIDYVHSQRVVKCLMCRRPLQSAPQTNSSLHRPRIVTPTAPPSRPYTPPQQTYEISYQQFDDLLNISQPQSITITVNTPTNNQNQTQPQHNTQTNRLRILLQVMCLAALVAIVVVILTSIA